MKVLELFSGTESFSKECRERGHECFTVDNDKQFNPDLCIDIMELKPEMIPFKPDIICLILGTDTYYKDPLASLCLEDQAFHEIGKRFSDFKKLAVFFAGGYSQKTPDLWIEFLKGLEGL